MTDTPPLDPALSERLRPFADDIGALADSFATNPNAGSRGRSFAAGLRALVDHLEVDPDDPTDEDPEPPKPANGRTEITEELMAELRAERDAAFAARRPSYIETSTTN